MFETKEELRTFLDALYGSEDLLVNMSSSVVKLRNFLYDESMTIEQRIALIKLLISQVEELEECLDGNLISNLPIAEAGPCSNVQKCIQLDLRGIVILVHGELAIALHELEKTHQVADC